MTLDETLFLYGEMPTVRFYSWLKPTVSYGYFQKHELFKDLSTDIERVRRLTGGSAILHQNEITYSITCPIEHPLVKDTKEMYCKVHKAFKKSLERLGIDSHFRQGKRHIRRDKLWCFDEEGDPLDLIDTQGKKILGSAQRRSHSRFLMHGSLPRDNEILQKADALMKIIPIFLSELQIDGTPSNLSLKEVEKVNENLTRPSKMVTMR